MAKSAQPQLVRPLRIAMVLPPWYEIPPRGYGGIEAVCAALVAGLSRRGHEVTVLGAGRTAGARYRFLSTMDELQHPRLGEAMPAVLHAARVEELLERYRFDLIHDHSPAGPLTAAHRHAPTVVTVHGPVDGQLGDLLEAAGPAIHPVAISESQRRSRPLAWAGTIHHGVDLDVSPEWAGTAGAAGQAGAPGLAGTAGTAGMAGHDGPVLWLARFHPDKGPDLAIQACRAAGLPLVLAGKCNEPCEERYLRDTIRPMLGDDVTLVVNGDRATTNDLLRRARCLLLPLRWHEPFGMVMIEAMASGTQVVAMRRGSVPEIVRPGVTGYICDDPEELPDALTRVPGLDPADCVAHVREAFGADLMARRYEALFRRVIGRVRPAPLHTAVIPQPRRPVVPDVLR